MLPASTFEADCRILPRRSTATPVVSVVMPVFRQRRGATERAIRSTLAQGFAQLELIIVDDGSVDGLFEILQRYHRDDDRICVLRYERNSGLPALRTNAGLARASGRYVTYQFEDDLHLPGGIAAMLAVADGDPRAFVYGSADLIDVTSGNTVSQLGHLPIGPEDLADVNLFGNAAVLHGRALLDEVGLFDPHIAMRRISDWDMWRRIGQCVPFRRAAAEVAHIHVGTRESLHGSVDQDRAVVDTRMAEDRRELLAVSNASAIDVVDLAFIPDRRQRERFRQHHAVPFLARYCTLDELQHGHVNRHLMPDAPLDIVLAPAREGRTASGLICYGNYADVYPELVGLSVAEEDAGRATEPGTILVHMRPLDPPNPAVRAAQRAQGATHVFATDDDILALEDAYRPMRFDWSGDGLSVVKTPMPDAVPIVIHGTGEEAEAIHRQLADCDYALVATQHLAERIGDRAPRRSVLPTNIPSRYILDRSSPRTSPVVRYVMIGGSFHVRAAEFALIAGELGAFFTAHRERTHLTVFARADEHERYRQMLPGVDISFEQTVPYRRYLSRLNELEFDFVLNPLRDDAVFFRAKSPIKYLEAAAAGAAVITSDNPSYRCVEDGRTGIKVPWQKGAWRHALDRSIAMSDEARLDMRRAAGRDVVRCFSTEGAMPRFYCGHMAARLHAALGTRRGPRRILVEHASAAPGIARLLRDYHFDVVSLSDLEPADDGSHAIDLSGRQIGLVLADGVSSACATAARRAGLPLAVLAHGPLPPLAALAEDARPDAVLAATPDAIDQAFDAGYPTARRIGEHVDPPRSDRWRPWPADDQTLRIAVAAETAPERETAAALAADAIGDLDRAVALLVPLDEERGRGWALRWPSLAEGRAIRFVGDRSDVDADILIAFGNGRSTFDRAVSAMQSGVPVVAAGADRTAAMIADGLSGIVVDRPRRTTLADAIRQMLNWRQERMEQLRWRAAAAAFVHGDRDINAAWTFQALVVTIDAWANRTGRAALSPHLSAPTADVTINVERGSRVGFLGFRSADPDGPRIVRTHDADLDWNLRSEATMGSLARAQTARFRVEGNDVEIGFAAERNRNRVAVAIGGQDAALPLRRGTSWWPLKGLKAETASDV